MTSGGRVSPDRVSRPPLSQFTPVVPRRSALLGQLPVHVCLPFEHCDDETDFDMNSELERFGYARARFSAPSGPAKSAYQGCFNCLVTFAL